MLLLLFVAACPLGIAVGATWYQRSLIPTGVLSSPALLSSLTTPHQAQCFQQCEDLPTCQAASFNPPDGMCSLYEEPYGCSAKFSTPTSTELVYSRLGTVPMGLIMFKISRDTVTSAYEYLLTTDVDPDAGFSLDPAVVDSAHYKHPWMNDFRNKLLNSGMQKIRVSLYKAGTERAWMEFRVNTGPSKTDYIHRGTVIGASWTDADGSFGTYSTTGHTGYKRHFNAIKQPGGSCGDSQGWYAVVENSGCTSGYMNTAGVYPKIYYSTQSTYGNFNTAGTFDTADTMVLWAIF